MPHCRLLKSSMTLRLWFRADPRPRSIGNGTERKSCSCTTSRGGPRTIWDDAWTGWWKTCMGGKSMPLTQIPGTYGQPSALVRWDVISCIAVRAECPRMFHFAFLCEIYPVTYLSYARQCAVKIKSWQTYLQYTDDRLFFWQTDMILYSYLYF